VLFEYTDAATRLLQQQHAMVGTAPAAVRPGLCNSRPSGPTRVTTCNSVRVRHQHARGDCETPAHPQIIPYFN
jgi:hypothetical protein